MVNVYVNLEYKQKLQTENLEKIDLLTQVAKHEIYDLPKDEISEKLEKSTEALIYHQRQNEALHEALKEAKNVLFIIYHYYHYFSD